MLRSFAEADALTHIPPGAPPLEDGDVVDVDLLEDRSSQRSFAESEPRDSFRSFIFAMHLTDKVILMKYFSALLVGAVAGGVAGLLLAPAKGEKTRKRLNKQAEKARKEMDELVKIGRNTYEDIRKLS